MCNAAINEKIRQQKIASGDMETIAEMFKDPSKSGLSFRPIPGLYPKEWPISVPNPARSVATAAQ